MITPRVLIEFLDAQPFRPFRLHTASGRIFDVRHPEMILVGKSTATVYAKPQDNAGEAERWERLSLMLVESVEPLEANMPTGSQG